MKKYRLKKSVIYVAFGCASIAILSSFFFVNKSLKDNNLPKDNNNYINTSGLEEVLTVASTDYKIGMPYLDKDVSVLKNYYDRNDESDKQENSILFYDSTYVQNSAIAYGKSDSFDVIAIYDGVVTSVKDDEMLGTIVEIEHSNNVISVYQSVSNVSVKVNQNVKKGQVIAKSGTSSLNKSLNNHVLFELLVDGKIVNPELFYGKNINEL